MPMNWTTEADAKANLCSTTNLHSYEQLFLGVLNQLRDAKLKLNHEKLADFMGPECLPGAVNNRIVRLRRIAEAGCSDGCGASGNGASNGNGEGGAGSDTSPLKRKAERNPRGVGRSKKAKTTAVVEPEPEADAKVGAEPQTGIAVKREHEHEADCVMNEQSCLQRSAGEEEYYLRKWWRDMVVSGV
ncbi:hypothetical protein BDV10DRAFT_181713 [Aspergillus recurvatus]